MKKIFYVVMGISLVLSQGLFAAAPNTQGKEFMLKRSRVDIPNTFVQQKVDKSTQIQAAMGIIRRMTPKAAAKFKLEIIPADNGLDVFEIESGADGKITVRGNSGVSLASGYYYYLKKYCHAMVSWCGDQLNLPAKLPPVSPKERITCMHKHRVYFNYCTLNYTASWWDWKRWEREIDFMAMNGINMPLSVVGLDSVWYYTLLQVGFTDSEAREYLVGPAYFAWQWMTNIQSHGGPLPKNWINEHLTIGRKILERQRALGMTPIQQGFTGCVPRLLKKKFPKANIVQEGRWVGFEGTAQLDPLDPLFVKLGTTFLETEKKLFGTSHVYAADPFHEGHPPRPGDQYLHDVGTAIYNLINNVDPGFTWAMQAWSIREHITRAIPKKQLLVLDLAGHRSNFWGYDYIKGQLHNFGGRINMHGDLRDILANPFAAEVKNHKLCKGMGLFMEGIEQNPVFYEAVFDVIWRPSGVNPRIWVQDYALRRYGQPSGNAGKAWNLLLDGPYMRGTTGVEKSSIIAARPALHVKKSGPNAGFSIPYNPLLVVNAWELLLRDSDKLRNSEGYQFDVADVGRQALSNLGQIIQKEASSAFIAGDRKLFEAKSEEFLQLLRDVDRLLAATTIYNYGKWVKDARSHGKTQEEKDLYERNAAMLVTIWGPENNPGIFDYAWREWAGLIDQYYLPRWQKFFNYLDSIMEEGGTYSDPAARSYGHETLRGNKFYSELADWELAWNKKQHDLPAEPIGNSVDISKELFKKYEPEFKRVYAKDAKDPALAVSEGKLGKEFSSWTPQQVSMQWGTIETDVTDVIDDAGTYTVTFLYTHGAARLDIKSASIIANGQPVAIDSHDGTTGNVHRDNQYTLKIKDFAFNTKYIFKAEVRTDGSNDSYGKILIDKKAQ